MNEIKKPYVKAYDENGIIKNPITRTEPYLHISAAPRIKRRGQAIYDFVLGGEVVLKRKVKSCKLMVKGEYPAKVGSRYIA